MDLKKPSGIENQDFPRTSFQQKKYTKICQTLFPNCIKKKISILAKQVPLRGNIAESIKRKEKEFSQAERKMFFRETYFCS